MPRPILAMVAGLVGLASGLGAARHRDSPRLDAVLAAGSVGSGVVVAVLQPRDCDSRLEALAPLVRAAESAGWPVIVRVPGSRDAAAEVRGLLADRGWPLDVAQASPPAVRALRRIGFTETPLVAVFDAAARLVVAAPIPASPEALVRWHALVPLVVRR